VLLLAQAPSPLRTLLNALSHRSRVKIAPELTRYRAISTMSAIGPKRTSLVAPHMSALRGEADTTGCGSPLLRSLLGVKRTLRFALHMSANDPKRTSIARQASSEPPFGVAA
jgi:hypothetical protein